MISDNLADVLRVAILVSPFLVLMSAIAWSVVIEARGDDE